MSNLDPHALRGLLRAPSGEDLKAFAVRAGVSRQTIYSFLGGHDVSEATLQKLAVALGVTPPPSERPEDAAAREHRAEWRGRMQRTGEVTTSLAKVAQNLAEIAQEVAQLSQVVDTDVRQLLASGVLGQAPPQMVHEAYGLPVLPLGSGTPRPPTPRPYFRHDERQEQPHLLEAAEDLVTHDAAQVQRLAPAPFNPRAEAELLDADQELQAAQAAGAVAGVDPTLAPPPSAAPPARGRGRSGSRSGPRDPDRRP